MNNRLRSLLMLLLVFPASSLLAQEYEYYVNTSLLELNEQGHYEDDNGDCFVECLLLDKYANLIETKRNYPEVIGHTEVVEKGNLRLSIAPKGTGWVLKRVENNCLSKDPNDCLVRCLVEYPKHLTGIEIIDDSKAVSIDDFSDEEISLLFEANYIVYSQAPCEMDQAELELLYTQFESDDDSLIEMIKVFQAKNGLPIGELNLETIYFIGLN